MGGHGAKDCCRSVCVIRARTCEETSHSGLGTPSGVVNGFILAFDKFDRCGLPVVSQRVDDLHIFQMVAWPMPSRGSEHPWVGRPEAMSVFGIMGQTR
jgi:hypothetical protein